MRGGEVHYHCRDWWQHEALLAAARELLLSAYSCTQPEVILTRLAHGLVRLLAGSNEAVAASPICKAQARTQYACGMDPLDSELGRRGDDLCESDATDVGSSGCT